MIFLIPLVLMALLIASAAGAGHVMRGASLTAQRLVGAVGAASVLLLPLVYDARIYDGNCFLPDGTKAPCALSQHLWESFVRGLIPMIPPVLIWLAIYGTMARRSAS